LKNHEERVLGTKTLEGDVECILPSLIADSKAINLEYKRSHSKYNKCTLEIKPEQLPGVSLAEIDISKIEVSLVRADTLSAEKLKYLNLDL
jgi:hypothetical protein